MIADAKLPPVADAEARLDELMGQAFGVGHPALLDYAALKFELKRFRAGRFTSEEIHGFCHGLDRTVSAGEFAAGCASEQRRLYGCSPDADAALALAAEAALLRRKIAETEDALIAGRGSALRSVVQPWLCALPLRMQSTVLLSLRGPDGVPKESPAKVMLRRLRSATIVAAFPGRPDSFMGDQRQSALFSEASALLDDHDAVPHHWLMHFTHAVEIVGQFHPDDGVRLTWWGVYASLCQAMHMNVETLEQLQERLK